MLTSQSQSGALRSTLSHYTAHYSRLCFPGIRRNLSDKFEHVQSVTAACDSLRCIESLPTVSQMVSYYTISLWRRRRGEPSQVVVSLKSCSVRPALHYTISLQPRRHRVIAMYPKQKIVQCEVCLRVRVPLPKKGHRTQITPNAGYLGHCILNHGRYRKSLYSRSLIEINKAELQHIVGHNCLRKSPQAHCCILRCTRSTFGNNISIHQTSTGLNAATNGVNSQELFIIAFELVAIFIGT